jgi:signal transduction histidine kinase
VAEYGRRVFGRVAQEHGRVRDRLRGLGEANRLLTSLHAVAQSLPASLDIDEVLASTISELHDLVDFDLAVVLLQDGPTGAWSIAAARGARVSSAYLDGGIPPPVHVAASGTGVWLEPQLSPSGVDGIDARSRSGAYMPLVARGRLLGVVVLEADEPDRFGAAEADLLRGLAEPIALALDNAQLFGRLRSVGAREERTRIARDLHDRVAQSLVHIGFELDRAVDRAGDTPVSEDLRSLRTDVRGVVTDVREALYDLRTDVTESRGLATTLGEYLARVESRSGIAVDYHHDERCRPPLRRERELWGIAQAAIANAERHSGAHTLSVRWRCDHDAAEIVVSDDGRGFAHDDQRRSDAYGLLGMRERADAIGARLEVESRADQGCTVRCRLEGW